MKKILLWILLFTIFLDFAYAKIEDNSIIEELNKNKVKELSIDSNLKSFKSCKTLEDVMWKYIKDYWKEHSNMYKNIRKPMIFNDSLLGGEKGIRVEYSSNQFSRWNSKRNYSKTNIQVLWVDEADIIKTDWDYIYYYNNKWEYKENKYIYIVN